MIDPNVLQGIAEGTVQIEHDPDDPWKVVVHEAGHAVASLLLDTGLRYVTVDPKTITKKRNSVDMSSSGLCSGFCTYRPADGDPSIAPDDLVVTLAGPVAEQVLCGTPTSTLMEFTDVDKAHEWAERFDLSLPFAVKHARRFVRRHREAIVAVAAELQIRPTLTREDVERICDEI